MFCWVFHNTDDIYKIVQFIGCRFCVLMIRNAIPLSTADLRLLIIASNYSYQYCILGSGSQNLNNYFYL